jgi:hypothetical protein
VESTLKNPDYYSTYKLEYVCTASANNTIDIRLEEFQTTEYYSSQPVTVYANKVDLPLTSYETGKVVRIKGSSYTATQEVTKTGNIFPTSGWSVEINKIKYSTENGYVIEADSVAYIGTDDFQVYKACDSNTNTYWSNANDDTNEHWVKITCPKPIKITKMKSSIYVPATSSGWVDLQGSKDGATWNYIGVPRISTTMTPAPELSEFEVDKPDFYKYYRIILRNNSTLHIYDWQTSEYAEIEEGAKTLNKLADRIDTNKMSEPAFKMVLTAVGRYAYPRVDGVLVVPIGCLKN